MLARLSDGTPASRGVVCLIAAIILFIKIPGLFTHPEFWAEDSILISNAYNHGIYSLVEKLGGTYLSAYGSIIALFAVQFPPVLWPWITAYAAHAAAILVVFMVTSPRFDFPHRGIAALAVVAAPVSDVFYGLANAQWILSIGLVVIPFCRPPDSKISAIGEAAFVLIAGLTGPFAAFALPVYMWRSYRTREARLMALSGAVFVCSVIQIICVANDLAVFDIIDAAPYDPLIWVMIPAQWLEWVRVIGAFSHHKYVIIITVMTAAIIYTAFSLREPHKDIKISLAFFASAILASGLYKYRHHLVLGSNNRYVFSGMVFAAWAACLYADFRKSAYIVALVVVLLAVNVYRRADSAFAPADVSWRVASEIVGRAPANIVIAPNDLWRVSLLH